jgi:5-methylcytosine-specific restriction endonuclease McrA
LSHVPAAVREQVRNRAGYRCEYCRKPEQVAGYRHHVDHVISQKHDGPSTLDNLAWACFQCNVNKGSDIAAYDAATGKLTALYNPRIQVWADHFELQQSLIVRKTPEGRVTVRLLQLNHTDQVEIRKSLIAAGLW